MMYKYYIVRKLFSCNNNIHVVPVQKLFPDENSYLQTAPRVNNFYGVIECMLVIEFGSLPTFVR